MKTASPRIVFILPVVVFAVILSSCKKGPPIQQYAGTYIGTGYFGENYPGMGDAGQFTDTAVVTAGSNGNDIIITFNALPSHTPQGVISINATISGNNLVLPSQTNSHYSSGSWSGTGSISARGINFNFSSGIPYVGFQGSIQ